MSALARVLREDGKKSMELATNILNIFFCLSNFSFNHQIITQNKIGDACLKIADQEFQRYDLWMEEMDAGEFYLTFKGILMC